jgi:hypothetical protein
MTKQSTVHDQPEELLAWLHSTPEERVASDLSKIKGSTDPLVVTWTKEFLESRDRDEFLWSLSWSDVRQLGRPGDISLVEITECQDPLCDVLVTGIVLRQENEKFVYLICSSETGWGSDGKAVSSPRLLRPTEFFSLLDQTQWLNSKEAVAAMEIEANVAIQEQVLEGDWPRLSITSLYPQAPQRFRDWLGSAL